MKGTFKQGDELALKYTWEEMTRKFYLRNDGRVINIDADEFSSAYITLQEYYEIDRAIRIECLGEDEDYCNCMIGHRIIAIPTVLLVRCNDAEQECDFVVGDLLALI